MTDLKEENPLHLSWHDLAWIPHLNPTNILDYFSQRSNPFYDHTCNNEMIKMQKLNIELKDMQGVEYILLHVQEPILFVIRKQTRHSPTQVTPVADYYIIAGYVYQAPDLSSLISFRLASGIHHLVSAFDEAQSYMRYHPTKGYSWEFRQDADSKDPASEKNKDKQKEEPSSAFQRARVDLLLGEICKKFFPKVNETAKPTEQKPEPKAVMQNGDADRTSSESTKPTDKDKPTGQASGGGGGGGLPAANPNSSSNFNRNQPADKKQRVN